MTRSSWNFARSASQIPTATHGGQKEIWGHKISYQNVARGGPYKKRNVMMDNFTQILQRLPTGGTFASSSHCGVATLFKVQVNFDIPIFDGQIDADVVDIWLNLLEGYFSVPNFFDWEKSTFSLLKATTPCQGLVGNLLWEKGWGGTLSILGHTHLEFFLRCHKGTILSGGELWGQVHPMDLYVVAAKRSRCAWAGEFLPYPAHQVG